MASTSRDRSRITRLIDIDHERPTSEGPDMTTTSTTPAPAAALAAVALALAGVLAGCSPEPAPADTPKATATVSPSATPTPDPTPTDEAPDDDADALPPGFPDPATLIGQEAYDEAAADGSWHTVVDGTPLELVTTFGACFDGGSGDICGYSIAGSVPAAADGVTQPAEVGLLLLLRSTGALADGTPTWVVLDALVAHAPGGEPAYFETCDGADGIAIYADPVAAPSSTIPVIAAWGPNAAVSALVEVDPTSISCAYTGD